MLVLEISTSSFLLGNSIFNLPWKFHLYNREDYLLKFLDLLFQLKLRGDNGRSLLNFKRLMTKMVWTSTRDAIISKSSSLSKEFVVVKTHKLAPNFELTKMLIACFIKAYTFFFSRSLSPLWTFKHSSF